MGHRSHRIYGPPYPWATVLWATLSTRKKIEGEKKIDKTAEQPLIFC